MFAATDIQNHKWAELAVYKGTYLSMMTTIFVTHNYDVGRHQEATAMVHTHHRRALGGHRTSEKFHRERLIHNYAPSNHEIYYLIMLW